MTERVRRGGSYNGAYKGLVRDTQDPDKLCRIRVFCPEVMGDTDSSDYWLDWALPSYFYGSSGHGEGMAAVPEVGTAVLVEFEQGNPEYPIWKGCFPVGETPSQSSTPALAKGDTDSTVASSATILDISGSSVVVPGSDAGHSVYPKNKMIRTLTGHVLEIDDTDSNGRIRIRHSSGSFMEWQTGGRLVKQVLGDFLVYVGEKLTVGVVKDLVLATGTKLLLGGASANSGVVLESSLLSVFNTHGHSYIASGSPALTSTPTQSVIPPTGSPQVFTAADFTQRVKVSAT